MSRLSKSLSLTIAIGALAFGQGSVTESLTPLPAQDANAGNEFPGINVSTAPGSITYSYVTSSGSTASLTISVQAPPTITGVDGAAVFYPDQPPNFTLTVTSNGFGNFNADLFPWGGGFYNCTATTANNSIACPISSLYHTSGAGSPIGMEVHFNNFSPTGVFVAYFEWSLGAGTGCGSPPTAMQGPAAAAAAPTCSANSLTLNKVSPSSGVNLEEDSNVFFQTSVTYTASGSGVIYVHLLDQNGTELMMGNPQPVSAGTNTTGLSMVVPLPDLGPDSAIKICDLEVVLQVGQSKTTLPAAKYTIYPESKLFVAATDSLWTGPVNALGFLVRYTQGSPDRKGPIKLTLSNNGAPLGTVDPIDISAGSGIYPVVLSGLTVPDGSTTITIAADLDNSDPLPPVHAEWPINISPAPAITQFGFVDAKGNQVPGTPTVAGSEDAIRASVSFTALPSDATLRLIEEEPIPTQISSIDVRKGTTTAQVGGAMTGEPGIAGAGAIVHAELRNAAGQSVLAPSSSVNFESVTIGPITVSPDGQNLLVVASYYWSASSSLTVVYTSAGTFLNPFVPPPVCVPLTTGSDYGAPECAVPLQPGDVGQPISVQAYILHADGSKGASATEAFNVPNPTTTVTANTTIAASPEVQVTPTQSGPPVTTKQVRHDLFQDLVKATTPARSVANSRRGAQPRDATAQGSGTQADPNSLVFLNSTVTFSPSVPNNPSQVVWTYSSADLPDDPGFSAANLQIVSLDPVTQQLLAYPSTVDTNAQTVTAMLPGIPPYMALAAPAATLGVLTSLPVDPQTSSTLAGVAVFNATNSAANPSVMARANNGATLASNPSTAALGPGQQTSSTFANLGSRAPGAPGWIQAYLDNPATLGVALLAGGSGLESLTLAPSKETMIIPGVELASGISTQINVSNATPYANAVTFELHDTTGALIDHDLVLIPAKGSYSAPLASVFSNASAPFQGYIIASGEQRLNVSIIESAGSATSALNGQPPFQGATTFYIPHFQAGKAMAARLDIVNPNAQDAHVTIQFNKDDGTLFISPLNVTIAAGTQYWTDLGTLLGPSSGSITVSSDVGGLIGDVTFGDTLPYPLGRTSMPLMGAQNSLAIPYVVNTVPMPMSLYALNTGSAGANVSVTVLDQNANIIGQSPFKIPAGGRFITNLSTLIPASSGQTGGAVQMNSDQPLTAIGMIQSPAGDYAAVPAGPSALSPANLAAGGGGANGTISVSVPTADFGPVNLGSKNDITLTIANTGSGVLSVTPAIAPTPPFSIVSPSGPLSINAGTSQPLTIRFQPATAGAQFATLTLTSTDSATPVRTLQFSATGVTPGGGSGSPTANVTVPNTDFGIVNTGATKDLTVTIASTGTSTLSVSPAISPNPPFSLVNAPAALSINAGTSQTLTVRFAPATTGLQTGTLILTTNDQAHRTLTYQFTGTGATSSGGGGGSGNIRSIKIEGGSYSNGVFTPTPLPNPTKGCEQGQCATFDTDNSTTNFALGVSTGLSPTALLNQQPNKALPQAGIGPGPYYTFSQPSWSWSGNARVTVTWASGPPDVAYFSYRGFNNNGANVVWPNEGGVNTITLTGVARTDQCRVQGTSTSPSSCPVNNEVFLITINSSSGGSSGSGGGSPTASVTVPNSNFGTVNPGSTKDLIVTIANTGTSTLSVAPAISPNPPFSLVNGPAALSINAGTSQTLTVRFAPATAGLQTGTLTLTTNDQAHRTLTYQFTGTGAAPSGSGGGLSCLSAPANLVSWWAGEGNANDSAGANNGAAQGSTSYAAGEVGQAFQFDGSSGYVSAGNPANLRFTSAMTIEAWINPKTAPPASGAAGTNMAAVLTKWGQQFNPTADADSYGLWLRNNNGSLTMFTALHLAGTSEPSLQGGAIALNTWTHVAMTYDGPSGNFVLYVNGQSVGSVNVPGAITTSTRNVLIGREDSFIPRPFNGLIDEVSVYSRALSATEIQSIFNAGSAGKCKSTGSGATPSSVVLKVDGGAFNSELGFPNGTETAYFVNRLTPPSYPASLTAVQIYFSSRPDGLPLNVPINLFVANNAGGSSTLSLGSSATLYSSTVVAHDAFITYTLPSPVRIAAGDFVVGFSAFNPPGYYPADLDDLTPSQKRSYTSTDGTTFGLIDSVPGLFGNLAIRAVVTVGGN